MLFTGNIEGIWRDSWQGQYFFLVALPLVVEWEEHYNVIQAMYSSKHSSK